MKHTKWKDPIAEKNCLTPSYACMRLGNIVPDSPAAVRSLQMGADCIQRLLVPQKVVFHESENGPVWDWYVCPVCGKRLRKNQPDPHCPGCGQLLNWEVY